MSYLFHENQKLIATGQDESGEKVHCVVSFVRYLNPEEQTKCYLDKERFFLTDCLISVNNNLEKAHSSSLDLIH